MIIFLVLILVVGAVLYLVFVVPSDSPRRKLKSLRRANMTKPLPPSSAGPVRPVPLGWTALDDQQLTRLLKGAAP